MAFKTRARARDARSVAKAGLGEVVAIWVVLAAVGTAVFVTYWRIPAELLYNVSRDGLAGALSRTIVYLNYPVALIAIALVAVVFDRSVGGRTVTILAALAAVLCAAVFVPGVVDPSDLDARPVNALAVTGVVLAAGLTLASVQRARTTFVPRLARDTLRVAIGAALLVAALPWIAAELGFYLGGPFLGSERPAFEDLAAVHLGHHHGMDGVLFALSALVLSRTLGTIRRTRLRAALALYLALMFVYGVANAAQDFWLEQLVKRGTVDWTIPSVLEPKPTLPWLVIVLATLAMWALAFRRPELSR